MKRCEMCSLESGESFYSTAWCEMWSGRIFQRINSTFEAKKKIKNKFFRHATYAKEIREKLQRQYFGIPEVEKFGKSFMMCVSKLAAGVWGLRNNLRVEFSARRWKREKNLRENLFFHARDSRRKNFFASNCGNGSRAHHFSKKFSSVSTLSTSEIKRWKKKWNEGWLGEWVRIGKNKKTNKRLSKWQRKKILPGRLLCDVLGCNY